MSSESLHLVLPSVSCVLSLGQNLSHLLLSLVLDGKFSLLVEEMLPKIVDFPLCLVLSLFCALKGRVDGGSGSGALFGRVGVDMAVVDVSSLFPFCFYEFVPEVPEERIFFVEVTVQDGYFFL